MRRLFRRAFNFSAPVSALLFMAACLLWVRGVWVNDLVARYTPSGSWDIQSWHGHLILHAGNDPGDSPPTRTSWWPRPVTGTDEDSPAFQRGWWNRVGFDYLSETYPTRRGDDEWPGQTPAPAIQRHRYLKMPLWFIALLSLALPASRLRGLLRWRQCYRLAHNLCRSCGYDLRAASQRCPECGTVPAPGARR